MWIVGVFCRLTMARVVRSADAQIALGIEPARRLEDVDAEHEIGLAVGDDRRDVIAAGLEKSDVRVDAAVADGQAVLVAEDDLVALAMTRAHQRGRRDADAHAADAGEIAVPGVVEVAPTGQGNLHLLEFGQARERLLRADDDDFLERRAGIELRAGGVVDAPGKIGLHLAPEIGLGEGQAGATGRAGADEAMLAGIGVDR